MKALVNIVKNYKFAKASFFLILFFWIWSEIIYAIFPQIIRKLMHIIETHQDYHGLIVRGITGIGLVTLSSIFWYIESILDAKIRGDVYKNKSIIYLSQLFKKSYPQIIDEWSWKLITKFTRGIEAEANIFTMMLYFVINTITRLALVFAIFAVLFPIFIVALLFFVGIMIIINYFIRNKIKALVRQDNKIFQKNNQLIIRNITDFIIVKIYGQEKNELNKSKQILKPLPNIRKDIRKYQIVFYIMLYFFIKSLEIGIYAILGYYVLTGDFSIAFLVMVAGYLWMMWHPIDSWIKTMNQITRQLETYKELHEFVSSPNPIKDWRKIYKFKKWEINFKNVWFSYNQDKYLFKNLQLKILGGKKNAIVGHSGWGKSTLIKLILRFYDYNKWSILIDQQELKELKIASLYQHIGYLPQEPGIFDWTIRENLEYAFWGNSLLKTTLDNTTKNKIIRDALKKAQIADTVQNLPKKLDTYIGEKWVKLSWGEKQRLAIARLFIKNPDIIILDEPTSALDSIAEHKITKALDELTKWKTSIIIAHRLQTVMHADQIIVMEKWKIVDTWKHNELIQKSKIYKTLVDLQNGKIVE